MRKRVWRKTAGIGGGATTHNPLLGLAGTVPPKQIIIERGTVLSRNFVSSGGRVLCIGGGIGILKNRVKGNSRIVWLSVTSLTKKGRE